MKKQIISIFVASIILTGLLSIFLFIRREKEIGLHWLTENSRSQLDLMGDLLNSDLEKMKGQLARIATYMEAGQTEEAQRHLGAFMAVGAMEAEASNFLWTVKQAHESETQEDLGAGWVQKLREESSSRIGIGFYATQTPEGVIRSGVSVPANVRDRRTGQVTKVRLVGILPRAIFQDLIDKLKIQGMHVFLTTESGLTLAHSVPEYLGNSMVGDQTFDEIRRQKNNFGSIKTKDVRGDSILSFFVKGTAAPLILVSQWRKDLWVMTDWIFYGQALFVIAALSLLGGALISHVMRRLGAVEVREVPVERIVERIVEKTIEKPVAAVSVSPGEAETKVMISEPAPLPSAAATLPQRPFSIFNGPSAAVEMAEPQVPLRVLDKVVATMKAPLLSVLGHVQLARLNPQGGSLQAIETEVRNARDILDRVGQYSGQAQPPSLTVPLYELVEAALRSVEGPFLRGGIKIVREIPPDLAVKCDIDEFKMALAAILRNSAEAMEKNLRKTLTLKARLQKGLIVFEVEDTGEGILPENMERIFDPFFTTRSSMDHRGLGLAMAQGVFRQHRAELQVRSRVGEGTCFTLKIPPSHEVAQSLSERSVRGQRELKTPSMDTLMASSMLPGESAPVSPTPSPSALDFIEEGSSDSMKASDIEVGELSALSLLEEDEDADGDFQFGRIDFIESKTPVTSEPIASGCEPLATDADFSRAELMAQAVLQGHEPQPSSSPLKRLKKKEEPLASIKVQIPRPEERL